MTPDPEGQPTDQQDRPLDIDTGFWLWVAALPLLLTGHIVDLVSSPADVPAIVYVIAGVFVFVTAAVVVTFLILMRQGYRWARTLLTAGGITSVVYAAGSLFTMERPGAVIAVIYAVTAIVGSVLVAGGAFLLHRADAHAYFTR